MYNNVITHITHETKHGVYISVKADTKLYV